MRRQKAQARVLWTVGARANKAAWETGPGRWQRRGCVDKRVGLTDVCSKAVGEGRARRADRRLVEAPAGDRRCYVYRV